MVKAACGRNNGPRHDTARPYSKIYTQPIHMPDVILGPP
jgi:hypothetical protein